MVQTESYPNTEMSIYVAILEQEEEDLSIEIANATYLLLLKCEIKLERSFWGLRIYEDGDQASLVKRGEEVVQVVLDLNNESILFMNSTGLLEFDRLIELLNSTRGLGL